MKELILSGFRLDGECINLTFILNDGVAFSMLAFMGAYLKYIQIALLVGVLIYAIMAKWFQNYAAPLGLILASGASNVYDRFIYGGVVDYVHWHCGFDFAIFNAADVLIDIGVVWALYLNYKIERQAKCNI
jgi:signal peptidase II